MKRQFEKIRNLKKEAHSENPNLENIRHSLYKINPNTGKLTSIDDIREEIHSIEASIHFFEQKKSNDLSFSEEQLNTMLRKSMGNFADKLHFQFGELKHSFHTTTEIKQINSEDLYDHSKKTSNLMSNTFGKSLN